MTTSIATVRKDTPAGDAMKLMGERQARHLPVIRADGAVAGVLEIRELFHERFEDVNRQLDSLE